MMIDVKNAEIVNMDNNTREVTFKLSTFYYNSLLLFPAKNNFVRLRIGKVVKARTTGPKSQNNHFWGHCTQLGNETGNDKKVMAEYILSQAVDHGYPARRDNSGNIIRNIYGDARGISMTHASTIDMSIAIEQAHIMAATWEPSIILKEMEREDKGKTND